MSHKNVILVLVGLYGYVISVKNVGMNICCIK